MIAVADSVQVVAKESGVWPARDGRPEQAWYRMKINNEGTLTHVDCSAEQFGFCSMFRPYDMVIEYGERGFAITATLNDVKEV